MAQLRRLSLHHQQPMIRVIEMLAAEADHALANRLKGQAQKTYLDGPRLHVAAKNRHRKSDTVTRRKPS